MSFRLHFRRFLQSRLKHKAGFFVDRLREGQGWNELIIGADLEVRQLDSAACVEDVTQPIFNLAVSILVSPIYAIRCASWTR